jgi:acetyl esterase
VIGDLDHYEASCAEIARVLDLPVVSVDYRLAPEFPWPAGPDDCEAATRWVAQSPVALDRGVTGVILAGDSAGGALALVTAMALRDNPAAVPAIAQMLLYPVTDLSADYPSHEEFKAGYLLEMEAMKWFSKCYGADNRHWRASPILGRLNRLPATLVVTAGLDPLRDEGRALAAAAVQAGVPTVFREAAGMIHGFLNFRRAIPSAVDDLRGGLVQLKVLIDEASAGASMGAST